MKPYILPAALALTLFATLASAQQTQLMSDGTQQSVGAQTQQAPAPDADQQQPPAPIERPHHAPNPQKQAAHLAQALNLTPDQQSKVEPILAAHDQAVASINANTALTPDQVKQQRHAAERDMHAQLAGVLTPDQLQQMKAMHREHERQSQPMQPAAPPQS